MNSQRTMPLFADPPPAALARADDPDTSHVAAALVDVAALQRLIYNTLEGLPQGATCGELAQMLRMPRDSISPRMCPMEGMRLVQRTDERRKLPGGRPQIVWRAL